MAEMGNYSYEFSDSEKAEIARKFNEFIAPMLKGCSFWDDNAQEKLKDLIYKEKQNDTTR